MGTTRHFEKKQGVLHANLHLKRVKNPNYPLVSELPTTQN
jgi:hypothetical protein